MQRRRGGVACDLIAGYNAQLTADAVGSGLQCRTSRRYEVHGWIQDMATKTAVAVKKQPRELTEEEILKAPDKDYMNEAQLAFCRKRLESNRHNLFPIA